MQNKTCGNRYIDIHSHMLPGVDDGAESLETAMDMLRRSARAGAEAVILTPHYSGRGQEVAGQRLRDVFEAFLDEVGKQDGLPRLYLGNEILWYDGALESLKSGEALSLADSRYVLTEFYPTSSYMEMERAVRSLGMAGYIPVIAHYERYRALKEDQGQERIEELMHQGALLQMNYHSLEKGGGLIPGLDTRWCRREVLRGHVSFLGTDAHDLGRRSPSHEEAAAWLTKHMDEEELQGMLYYGPLAVIGDTVYAGDQRN